MLALPVLREVQHLVGLPLAVADQQNRRRRADCFGDRLVERRAVVVDVVAGMMLGFANVMMTLHLARCADVRGLRAPLDSGSPDARLIARHGNRDQSIHSLTHGKPFSNANLPIPIHRAKLVRRTPGGCHARTARRL